jgi:hypothetical protein
MMDLCGSGKVIFLPAGNRVHQGMLKLRKPDGFPQAMSMERCYLLKHIKGELGKLRLAGEEVGCVNCLHGRIDGVDFFAMQYAVYKSLFISKYVTLNITTEHAPTSHPLERSI